MNTALQAIVVPALRASGFKGSLPHFSRITASHIHLLTFPFDRYGGGFVIEAAIAPNQPFKTRWGQTIAPNQLNAHDLDARCRIHPDGIRDNSSTDDWFRYDKRTLFKKNIFKKLAQRARDNLQLAENYWREMEGSSGAAAATPRSRMSAVPSTTGSGPKRYGRATRANGNERKAWRFTMISTRNLSSLGDVDQIRRLTQSLAVLDAIVCPIWEDRYYAFNAQWGDGEMMASMRNGSGDEWYLFFNAAGAIMKGLDHESAMFTFRTPREGVYDEVPEAFQSFLKEPAFDIENVSFCIWRTFQDASWRVGNIEFPAGRDPDGSAGLLAILDGNPETYREFADDYHEIALDIDAIDAVYAHRPLSDDLVRKLNPEMDLKAAENDLAEIGYGH